MSDSTLKLIAIIIPLGLDTLAVSIALGLAGLPPRRRMRLSILFAAFEAAMPLIGLALGAPLGHAIGGLADYLAAGLILVLGTYMFLEGAEEHESERLLPMMSRGALGVAALGASISLDELAIGFSAGLLRLPVLPIVIAAGVQAFVVTQFGVRLGSRVAERWRGNSGRLAGVALVLLGLVLALAQLTA